MSIPFIRDFDPAYGACVRVSPRVRRLTARNPGPFTFAGTNTHIVGEQVVAVIDPGPDDPGHLKALLDALEGQTVRCILTTHTHRDHSPLARDLARAVDAPVLGLAAPPRHDGGLEEAQDWDFRPDRRLTDAEVLSGPDWTLAVMATPGHASNHLSFVLKEENALFSGDHVMGWSTTIVAPPDGDMLAYMDSLRAVMARDFDRLYPAHGAPIPGPATFLQAYLDHRLARETQILDQLATGASTIVDMVPRLYANVDPGLWPAAAQSVLAHLIALVRQARVACDGPPTLEAVYRLP